MKIFGSFDRPALDPTSSQRQQRPFLFPLRKQKVDGEVKRIVDEQRPG